MWLRVASVVCDIIHVVSCGQRGARDVSCSSASTSALIVQRCASSKETFLGHNIGRNGSSHDEERCQEVVTFHLSKRNSTPSSFWAALIGYMDTYCTSRIRTCGQRVGVVAKCRGRSSPKSGLGSAATAMCKAFKVSKQMMKNHICFASFDEASAADEPCPREQIADASGIAVGGTVLQMMRGLSRAPT